MSKKLKTVISIILIISHAVAELLITSVSLSNDAIAQVANYNFQIVRYGTLIPIPANTKVEISFPNQYSTTTISSCIPIDWVGTSSLNCSYSQLKLVISGGFPASSTIQDFAFQVQGIKNPSAANVYSSFAIRLLFPNGTFQNSSGSYSVTITTANAICSMTLISGLVFGEGLLTINYQSQYINSSSVGYTMKLSMLQSYPTDPTNTDINPVLSVSNTLLSKYLFEFSFTNSFNLTMLMPPSTQPETNFIFIMTSNVLGDYDKCYVSIQGVQSNTFTALTFSSAQVQSLSNLQISFLSNTPILPTDLIRINFALSDFDLSSISNFATFTKGAIGQKPITVANKILTIRNVASFIIVSQIGFGISNLKFPFSNKPQSLTIYIQTDNGYIRNQQTYSYTSSPGTLLSPIFNCLVSQIGYQTSCTFSFTTKNQIKDTSYIQIDFPISFKIINGYMQCRTSGGNLNSVSNCNSYSLTNSIKVTGIAAANTIISSGTKIQVTIPTLSIPTQPSTQSLTIATKTQDDYTIDTGVATFKSISRSLLSSQISIQSSSKTTSTITNYTITLTLPLNLGIPFTLQLFIPFANTSSISVNGNFLPSSYNPNTSILTVQNVGNSILIITGFQTYQSTAPVTLWGNLLYNGTVYFYFTGYDVVMVYPREIVVFYFGQSNAVVGNTFKADLIISDLKVNDIVKIPNAYYAINQTQCSDNCVCGPQGLITIKSINNYDKNVTKFSTNLINNGYIATTALQISVYDSSGVFLKQVKNTSIRTQILNNLYIESSQSNPYYTEVSTYTFNVTMTTYPPKSSLNNILSVSIPSQFTIQEWACIFGCTAPDPPPIQNTLYFSFSSIRLQFTIKLVNPVSFLSPIQMTSSSLGDMDYGTYLPVSPCLSPCRSCDSSSSSLCLSCYQWSSENKLRNGTCVSNCSSGEYYDNSTLSCKSCHNYCLSCVNSSTICYTCKPDYYYFQLSCRVDCPAAYYKTNTGQCGMCQKNCLNCTSTVSCIKCSNNSYLYLQSCWANCQQGTYVNPIANECLNCSFACISCDATGCLTCQNNYYLYNKLCYEQCPSGLFKAINTCQPCQSPCLNCSITSTNCTSCMAVVNSTHYYYLANRCYQQKCPDSYYISPLDNSCLQCQSPCENCNRTHCITCKQNFYFYLGFCSTQCQVGTYPLSNFTCVLCLISCLTCQSQSSCTSCISPYILYNSTCILNCPEKFYESQNVCKPCLSPCFTCQTATTCKSCVSLIYFNGSCLSACPSGYYSSEIVLLNTSLLQCSSCVYPCQTCTSLSLCLSCVNSLKLFNQTCIESCPAQYYNQNSICFACSFPCKTCNTSGCITCANNQLYLQQQKCLSNCSLLHPNNVTMICQACKYPCATCTWSDSCLSCQDPFIYYGNQCIRVCPNGMYNSNQICLSCPNLCSTCYLVGDQVRCPTCKQGNYFYGYDCVSTCPQNTTLEQPYCFSSNCQTLTDCSSCSNLRCLECNSNFTLNQNTGKCQAIVSETTTITAISQIPVPFPFLIATVLIIISAFLIRIQFNKMFAPLFIYSFVGIAQCGVLALWVALVYLKGVNSNQSGVVLKIAATALVGVYVLFNIFGFICYLKITRNDKKFKTWEKQDNKSTSIVISIISLIFSFRFSLLKYSKLGHLLKFSATLSHDSKLSHENMMGFLSIILINIPAIVISAWIAYLQTSMNYLFFTSIQVATLSVVMIILAIVQSLTPKDYTLEKREEFKQGHDVDSIDDHSLSQMMVKLGVIQQQYHEGKQILSQQGQVGKKNQMSVTKDLQDHDGGKTTEALIFPKEQDQKLSFQSQIHQNQSSQMNTVDEREQLENILMEAQSRALQLNRPSRPAGMIKKQTLKSLQDASQDSSEGIQFESDEQPPPINSNANKTSSREHKRQNSLLKQQKLDLKQLKNFLELEERKMGMRKLEQLFEILKKQEQQQKQLMQRLQKITEQQKRIKQDQYEKAKQIIETNQKNVEQRITKVQKIMSERKENQKIRKQKIKQLQIKRKQYRQSRSAQNSLKKNLIYPINEETGQSGVGEKEQKNMQTVQNYQSKAIKEPDHEQQWNQQQNQIDFKQNTEWKMKSERLSPELKQQPQKMNENKITEPLQQFKMQEAPHWPIDPELQQKISQVQQRAEMYIKKPKQPQSLIQELDMDLQSFDNNGDQIVFKQEDQSAFNDDQEEKKDHKPQFINLVTEETKVPKRRVNRSIMNLSPNQ